MKGIHTNSKIARMPDSLMLVGSGMLAEFYNFLPCLAVSVNVHEIIYFWVILTICLQRRHAFESRMTSPGVIVSLLK